MSKYEPSKKKCKNKFIWLLLVEMWKKKSRNRKNRKQFFSFFYSFDFTFFEFNLKQKKNLHDLLIIFSSSLCLCKLSSVIAKKFQKQNKNKKSLVNTKEHPTLCFEFYSPRIIYFVIVFNLPWFLIYLQSSLWIYFR